MLLNILTVYLLLVNAIGFQLMLVDKRRAQKKQWRIPEATLITVSAIGGSVGSLLGMYTFRHKTRHPKFFLGIPAILLAQLALACFIFAKI